MTNPRIKHLRRNATEAETLLWHQLRLKRVGERRFRRQFPLGDYIVDFVCLSAKIVVEMDGESHGQTVEFDARRTRWLEARGYRVVRFTNGEVMANLDGVVRTIELALCDSPLPLAPSLKGRGDRKKRTLVRSPLPLREGVRGRGTP